jgi:hypothetical protein
MIRYRVSLRPGTSAYYTPSIELPGPTRKVTVLLSFRWLPRLSLWCVLVTTLDGSRALSMQQHVRPGGQVYMDIRDPEAPEGRLFWTGPDPYTREDLGDAVELWWVPA